MSTMESPTALINALYSFSFTTSLLASNLSTATPTDQTCVAAAAEFKKEADKAHALFRIAIQSGRDAAQDVKEEQEDEEEQKPKEIQGDKGEGEGEAGPPKRRLVSWSERVSKDVENRLQTHIVPNIQRGFQAYLETRVIPDLENRVLMTVKEHFDNRLSPVSMLQDPLSPNTDSVTLEPPPYDVHERGAVAPEARHHKRSHSESSPPPDDHHGPFSSYATCNNDEY